MIWADRVRTDIAGAVFSGGDIVMHVETGTLYRMQYYEALRQERIEPDVLTQLQRRRANKWRLEAWPQRGHRKGIGSTKAKRKLPDPL